MAFHCALCLLACLVQWGLSSGVNQKFCTTPPLLGVPRVHPSCSYRLLMPDSGFLFPPTPVHAGKPVTKPVRFPLAPGTQQAAAAASCLEASFSRVAQLLSTE